jgi:hypothetical protein
MPGDGGAGPKAGEGCCPIAGSSMFMLECRQLARRLRIKVSRLAAWSGSWATRSGELRTMDESRLLSGSENGTEERISGDVCECETFETFVAA